MSILSDLRAKINDVDTSNQQYSDTTLTSLINQALLEVNSFNEGSTFTIANLDAGAAPGYIYLLTLDRAGILVVEGQLSDWRTSVKLITQDSTVDPGDVGSALTKALANMFQLYREHLGYFLAIDASTIRLGVLLDYTKDVGDASVY